MQRCKYLDELGLDIAEYGTNFVPDDDERAERWAKEREEYGFDSRETWCLDKFFVEWFYTRLMMYKEKASEVVDLTFHKFEWEEKEITQIEAIDYIIEECKFFLLSQDDFEKENEAYERMQKAIVLWSMIFGAMWW